MLFHRLGFIIILIVLAISQHMKAFSARPSLSSASIGLIPCSYGHTTLELGVPLAQASLRKGKSLSKFNS